MLEINKRQIRTWQMLGPSGTIGWFASQMAKDNENLMFLTADLVFFSGLEKLRGTLPSQLINVGIAEQNLIGVGAGLAKEGFSVFATSYASFAATRCLDQIKMNMGYMKLPIKLIGLTAGFGVSILGPSHMAIEDVGILNTIPNLCIVSPADMTELVKIMDLAVNYPYPMYIRITSSTGNPVVYTEDYPFQIGKAVRLREGKNIAILANGSMVNTALKVQELLLEQQIQAAVYNVHTIKPMDLELLDALKDFDCIFTLEEHSVIGGLGSTVSDYYADLSQRPRVIKFGIPDTYYHAASYEFLIQQAGLSPEQIASKMSQLLDRGETRD